MSKITKIIVGVVIGLAIIGGIVFYNIAKQPPNNPVDARGNTAGNLINGGTFCEYNNKVFFSNPYDQGRLYSMDPDCSNIERISDDSASYINAYGNHLYFIRNNNGSTSVDDVLFIGELYGVVRTTLDGSKETTLFAGFCTDLNMAGKTLVYNANESSVLSTFTMGLDGSDKELIYGANLNNGSITYNESVGEHYIYYSNNDTDHSVYMLSTETGTRTLYWACNSYMATEYNGCIYYIDLDNNYALTCLNPMTNTLTVLCQDRVVLYNIYDDVIIYQTENTKEHHALKRMKTDGSAQEEIVTGDIISINCTSEYTFLTMYGSDLLYRVPTYSGQNVEKFLITFN